LRPSVSNLIAKDIVKIEWEREDYLFIIVYPICLFFIPTVKHSNNFYELSASYSVKFYTNTPLLTSWRMFKFLRYFRVSSRSIIC
jgi:hypothetical protein